LDGFGLKLWSQRWQLLTAELHSYFMGGVSMTGCCMVLVVFTLTLPCAWPLFQQQAY
jgi:hypothetical protein